MPTIDRAESTRKLLFERYDQLNALWNEAEKQLTKLHIPRPVSKVYHSYELDPHLGGGCAECFCLGMQKIKGKWRVCHGVYVDQQHPYEVEEWTPIVDAAVEDRVRAAAHVPDLRRAIIESAEKFIPEVDEAIAELAKGLEAVQASAKATNGKVK